MTTVSSPHRTDITLLLDRSGSMASIKSDTIGGINSFITDQRAQPGDCTFSLIQFDSQDRQEIVIDARPIADATLLTPQSFTPRGGTPLYDAIGLAIVNTGARLSALPSDRRPQIVIFVIVTDGQENESHEYSRGKIFEMIQHQSDVYKWQFVYLGANQNAMQVGSQIGVSPSNSMTYAATPDGVNALYTSMSANTSALRSSGDTKSLNFDPVQRAASLGIVNPVMVTPSTTKDKDQH